MMAFLCKWLWCSWAHRADHCHPTVWGPDQAMEMGIPYRPRFWHCARCHSCAEGLDKALKEME